jgi:hypothetical protein
MRSKMRFASSSLIKINAARLQTLDQGATVSTASPTTTLFRLPGHRVLNLDPVRAPAF